MNVSVTKNSTCTLTKKPYVDTLVFAWGFFLEDYSKGHIRKYEGFFVTVLTNIEK